jgi:uncharacterized membrane protein
MWDIVEMGFWKMIMLMMLMIFLYQNISL